MRFDDRLATALGQMAETPASRQAVWRQLVDILGQSQDASAQRDEALQRLRDWRGEVPAPSRQSAAIMLAGHDVPVDLVELFAEDLTAVAAPLLAVVKMPVDCWVDLIPRLSPVARALLRHRRDLPPEAKHVLEAYGPVDLVIPAPAQPAPEERPAGPQDLHALRARIDALREERRRAEPAEPPVDSFDYETGPDGVIRWCSLAQRGAVLGVSIAEPAQAGTHGVDGQAAGAFRHRSPFTRSRLSIASGVLAGAWSLSGVPSFDPASGRFLGYRGTARRPQVGERADEPGLLGMALTGDSARQFAHEMRTPLNAIAGFAEMIQRQMLGPAGSRYREQAAEIMEEARRIGAVLDELEDAARIGGRDVAADRAETVDCTMLVARLASAIGTAAAEKGVAIVLRVAPQGSAALVAPALAERLIGRLISTCVGLAGSGERLEIEVAPGGGGRPETNITVSRPACVAELSADSLMDACDVDGAEVEPPLGLGFTLRLVRHAAEACGGRFRIDDLAFVLLLPAPIAAHAGTPADADGADRSLRQSATASCQAESGSAIAASPAGPVAQW